MKIKLSDEYSPLYKSFPCNGLSTMLQTDDTYCCLCRNSPRLQLYYKDGSCRCVDLSQPYKKITRDRQRNLFYAIAPLQPDAIYVLNHSFCEIGCLRIKLPAACSSVADIWFDEYCGFLLVLLEDQVIRFNRNGDCLGTWMVSPRQIQYTAICTYEKFVFLSYEKSACTYIASYTNEGIFLERLCLGVEYAVIGMQALAYGDALLLRVFAKKDSRFLVALDIELMASAPHPEPGGCDRPSIAVECTSEIPGLYPTCYVEQT